MPTLAALISRFSAGPRVYLQTAKGVQEPAGRRGRRYWVVGRSLCRFFKVPLLPEAAAGRQLDALDLQIKRLSPFAETGSHFHFGPDFISLWLWDEEAVRSAGEAIGVDVARLRVVPEPALLPHAADGVRLVETSDGIEGQSWIRGGLAASRWWPVMPDARAWVLFQRGASVAPDRIAAATPPAARLDWLLRPWTQGRTAGSFDLGALDLRLAAAGIGALILIAYGYLGAEWLRLSHDVARAESEISARSSETEPGLRARSAALENQAAIHGLRQLDPFPSQLAVMARIAEILPKNETHLTDWTYERGQLEMSVAADHPLDALFFVRPLERVDGFKGVTAERAGGDNSLRIRLAVDPK